MFWRRRTNDDFSKEVQAHLDLETDRLIAEGLSPTEARAAARRAFGNVTIVKERFYEASRWMWFEDLVQDLRYAARGLRQSPAFLATTVLTLAVGLGLVTVAFTFFNAYVLRPYAIRDPFNLHQITWRTPQRGGQMFRWREYEEVRARRDLFDAVVAEGTRFVSSNGRPLAATLVSDNYFATLGPDILLGRGLGTADANGGDAVVLSHDSWKRLFAGDAAAIGRELDLNGRPFVIVGVLRPEFVGLGESSGDVWILFTTYAAVAKPALMGPDQPRSVEITGRLGHGVTADHAQSALAEFITRAVDTSAGVRAEVTPHASPNPFSLETLAPFLPIFAAFALVLVTACANVSNVMLARAHARQREIAVRLAVGASRGRVVRQLLTEGLLISLLAGLSGLALAEWALQGGAVLFFSTLPAPAAALMRVAPMSVDHRVFLFALAVAAIATLMFALLPALRASRLTLTGALRGHGSSVSGSSRLRGALVVSQMAVSLVLVIVAMTLARNGSAVGRSDLGYDTHGVVSINMRDREEGLVGRLAGVLTSDPNVAELAVTSGNPLFVIDLVAGRGEGFRTIAAAPSGGRRAVSSRYTFVSPEYFAILRMPIVHGRGFRLDEAGSAALVAVVSAATATRFWPDEDPLGKTIRIERPEGRRVDDLGDYAHATVIGIIDDHVSGMVIEGPDRGHIYFPINAENPRAAALLVRGRSERNFDPRTWQQLFTQVATDPQIFEAMPLDEMRALQAYPLVAAAWVGWLLGAVALALSVSGLYGVLVYTLTQRTKEIGIRMALGATAGVVVRLVLRQSARLAGIGAIIGLAVAFALLKMLNAVIRFPTVTWLDAVAFGGGLALVLAASALGSYQPVRRATRVDPSEALRADV